MDLRSRVRLLERESARIGATGPGRWFGAVAGVPVTSLGVPTPWSVQALVGDPPPDDDALAELLPVLDRLGTHGYQLMVPVEHAEDPRWSRHGLREIYRMPAFALAADRAAHLAATVPEGLTIRRTDGREEFVVAYGGWAGGVPLAEGLVTPADMRSGHHEYWVAEAGDVVVGTAILHRLTRATGLSGIGVLEHFRRRGFGAALTVVATREAAVRVDAHGDAVDLVWMHASGDGAPLYERLGFAQVDVRVAMSPVRE